MSMDREGLPVPAIMGRLCVWRSRRAPQTFATYKVQGYITKCGKMKILPFTP